MSIRICPNCGWANKSGAKFCSQCGAILTSPVTLKPGTALHNGRYVIDKQLGKGGMGATYLAKDTQAFDRPCVIKVMLPYFDLDDPNDFQLAIKRFEQEARALAELGTHPNIPNLLHWFEEGGQFFLVMEFIEGENLKEKLHREGPQSPEQVIRWGISLCRTLEFLESKGYVHHDIKPDNIILHADSGEPILVDFGTVKAGKLATKASFGTQGYAPPEQMMPPYQTEHRSDAFALAATLYHLLTGDHPAQNLWAFPKLHTIPQPLQDALREALNLDVNQRPTAREFREKLEQCLRPQLITAPLVSKSGEKLYNPEDFIAYAERHWDEALEYFQSGDMEVWLKSFGLDLTQKAEDAKKKFPKDPNAALQTFLESLNPLKAPRPKIQVNPATLDFGHILKNQQGKQQLEVKNIGNGYLFGRIAASENWIDVSSETIACLPRVSQIIQVAINPDCLPYNRDLQGMLILNTNGGTLSVPVRCKGNVNKLTNSWAMWALVFALMPFCYIPISAVVGLWTLIFGVFAFFVSLVSLLVAIVFGIVGLKKAKELGGYGRGSAIAAIVIATLTLLVAVIVAMEFGNPNSTQSFSPLKFDQPLSFSKPKSDQPLTSAEPQHPIRFQTTKPTSKLTLAWKSCWNCNGVGNRGACRLCDGKGYITCSACEGHGMTPLGERCVECDGKGVNTCFSCICSSCEGTGKVWGYICSWCKGSGRSRKPCWDCSGRGYEKCFLCESRGLCLLCVGEGYFLGSVCSFCGGSGRCKFCSGGGRKVCSRCNGTGLEAGLEACSGCDGKGIIKKDQEGDEE